MANFTEKAIRTAFLELLNERPLSKITVKDITDRCGINRNSFYYHYQDVPTLIQDILTGEINRIIKEHPTIDSIEACMNVAVSFAAENKRAIMHIYNSVNRDMFEQYLWRICEHTVSTYLSNAFPDVELSEQDRKLIIRYDMCELFGFIMGWLYNGMREDVRPLIKRMCEIENGASAEMIKRCARNK